MNATPLHLSPDELAMVREILQRRVPGREVWAFGSRAGGTPRASSDLDLAVLGDAPLSVAVSGDLREAFTESALPFRVDVVDWAETGAPFREVIRRRHMVIQPASPVIVHQIPH
ncbi:MAG: nucleotidyltransferase domain-containing protein [Lentisphaeria bacterium]